MEMSTATDDLSECIARLRSLRSTLAERGIIHVGVFGSLARGEATSGSDVDLIIEIDRTIFSKGGLDYFGRLEELAVFLAEQLKRRVDVAVAPISRELLAAEIKRDRVDAF